MPDVRAQHLFNESAGEQPVGRSQAILLKPGLARQCAQGFLAIHLNQQEPFPRRQAVGSPLDFLQPLVGFPENHAYIHVRSKTGG
jgi:hypothetical protein